MKRLIVALYLLVAVAVAGPAFAGAPAVTGTVVEVDAANASVTITETETGLDRTYTDAKRSDLESLKPGDTVSVTAQSSDSSKAEKVQKT